MFQQTLVRLHFRIKKYRTKCFFKNPHWFPKGNILLIVPPFADIDSPILGVHLLQANAKKYGYQVNILYTNTSFVYFVGTRAYRFITDTFPARVLLGEAIFSHSAYDMPPLEQRIKGLPDFWQGLDDVFLDESHFEGFKLNFLFQLEKLADEWVQFLSEILASLNYPIIGCSTSYQQTSASIALLKKIKSITPSTTTIIGGANCEGEMAEGIASLSPEIDYVFSGESEQTLVEFLKQFETGHLPEKRIIRGILSQNLDSLPEPDYRQFFDQRSFFFGRTVKNWPNQWLVMESSRGCWWGEKNKCTFCGLNTNLLKYRVKNPESVYQSLQNLTTRYPIKNVKMIDNVMPETFFTNLVPKLINQNLGINLFYEIKPNMTFEQTASLKKAGINHLLVGIETLSTPLLKLMNKGCTASQNICFLRYGRMLDLRIFWNFLYRIPGDNLLDYSQLLELFPLIIHLTPPGFICPVRIDRFSKYHDNPTHYGISNLRPLPLYELVFPQDADFNKIAYYFEGDYPSESRQNLAIIRNLYKLLQNWWMSWGFDGMSDKQIPQLTIETISNDRYQLIDTRGIPGLAVTQTINHAQVLASLINPDNPATEEWALQNQVGIRLDQHFVPLATTSPDLYQKLITQS